jgi:hypothetical protein
MGVFLEALVGVRPPLLQIFARDSWIESTNGDPGELDDGHPRGVAIC